jgi:predicted amidohydrolase YtcJ
MTHRRLLVSGFPMSTIVLARCHACLISLCADYASVSRMMINGEKFYPEHAMTREEALQTYTLNNAIAAFEEDIKGALTPGKFADIVVLSQDLLTVEKESGMR